MAGIYKLCRKTMRHHCLLNQQKFDSNTVSKQRVRFLTRNIFVCPSVYSQNRGTDFFLRIFSSVCSQNRGSIFFSEYFEVSECPFSKQRVRFFLKIFSSVQVSVLKTEGQIFFLRILLSVRSQNRVSDFFLRIFFDCPCVRVSFFKIEGQIVFSE